MTTHIESRIERRLLINYRAQPDLAASLVPPPFEPQVVNGFAVIGICLIRLESIRPAGFPGMLGLTSENVAHRIAVQQTTSTGIEHGVYIPRRDTSSLTTASLGGRAFPGVHRLAAFNVNEQKENFEIEVTGKDLSLAVSAELSPELNGQSLFESLDEAERFFSSAPVGYSPNRDASGFDAVRLRASSWRLEPLDLNYLHSSYWANLDTGRDALVLDSAFLMRNVSAVWEKVALE